MHIEIIAAVVQEKILIHVIEPCSNRDADIVDSSLWTETSILNTKFLSKILVCLAFLVLIIRFCAYVFITCALVIIVHFIVHLI